MRARAGQMVFGAFCNVRKGMPLLRFLSDLPSWPGTRPCCHLISGWPMDTLIPFGSSGHQGLHSHCACRKHSQRCLLLYFEKVCYPQPVAYLSRQLKQQAAALRSRGQARRHEILTTVHRCFHPSRAGVLSFKIAFMALGFSLLLLAWRVPAPQTFPR